MKEIGGYFELEIAASNTNNFMHSNGALLNSGRHALEFILRSIESKPKKIFLPFYTCDVVLQPLNKLGIDYEFYNITENLEILNFPSLKEDQYLIINNYFGIKDEYISNHAHIDKNKIIIDQSQGWFAKEISGIKAFYSPRKFFGVPDGGIAIGVENCNFYEKLPTDISWHRFNHLLKRHELKAIEGYEDFKKVSIDLSKDKIKKMSILTKNLLNSIDMKVIQKKRKKNFKFLHDSLGEYNKINIPTIDSFECPLVYPFLSENKDLKHKLIENHIFIATYWPNVLNFENKYSNEFNLAQNLISLPIDQRYNEEDMQIIIDIIRK